jgi:DNA-binding response OmpR family regulator
MNATPPTETGIRPVVAVLNSADDVIEMLRVALEDSGFAVVSAKLSEIQSGVMDLVAFVSAHRPAAIVYDLPRPYEANWNFLRLLRETAFLNRLGWVLTTLDKAAQEAAVGPASVVQIVLGKPYGLDEVVAAVRQSLLRDGRGQDGHGRDGQALDGQIHDGHDGNTLTRDGRPLAHGPFG